MKRNHKKKSNKLATTQPYFHKIKVLSLFTHVIRNLHYVLLLNTKDDVLKNVNAYSESEWRMGWSSST